MEAMTEERQRRASGTLRLAHLEGTGCVQRCDAGCFHITFGEVTLDFRDEAGFHRLAARLQAHRRGLSEVELRYGAVLLRLSPDEFDRLVELVTRAATHWQWVTELCDRPAA